uniref:Isoform G of Diacylglycerol kinase 1 n=1 Tax=Drosophila melanogaster TaxID=7227 RepID=Q01583-2|eukprot:NP_523654.2 diacyl glycerol kinase, isoform G [Drosophila melanogaster]
MRWELRYGWQIVTFRTNCATAAAVACHQLLCPVSLTSAVEIMPNSFPPEGRRRERRSGNLVLRAGCCCIGKYFLHNRCASSVKKECTLGEYSELIVPPTAICPAVLDRQRSVNQAHKATHFQITPPDELSCPLLVFVNPKSGGRQGDRILRKFQYMLNPRQVYDLSKGGPKEGLTLFKDLPRFRVICCGGDGTVGWVLEAMDSIELASQPAIGVIPLGTGNDLARCLRWGGGYEGENIPKLMDKFRRASTVMLDRWSIEVTNTPHSDDMRPKVTLHSNMQKVIELSQSVVVDKSLMERFEEIQRQSKQVATSMGTAASSTSIMMASKTETEMETMATMEFGSSTTTTNRTTTTKSISMSTFETQCLQQTLRTAMSSSSSNTSSGSPCNGNQDAETEVDSHAAAAADVREKSVPRRSGETEKQSLETLLLQHKQQMQQQQQQQQQGVTSLAVEEAATATPVGSNQSDNSSQRNKQNNILKQQITLSLDLSDHEDEPKDDGGGAGDGTKSNGNSIPATPATPITPTTPNAASSVLQQQQQQHLQFEQQQKPIKVQSDKDCTVPYNIINNYFSVGVDAAICVKFHLEREKNPHKFNSRMKNKLWYFEYATSETFAASCKNLHESIEIVCDGVALDLANGPHLQGVALLNIPYTHGGSNLWGEHLSQKRIRKSAGPFGKSKKLRAGDKEFSATSFNSVDLSVAIQDFGDRLIEVIGLENCLHMGQVRTGLRASGRRLAQCSEVIIKTKKTFPMQIDGEPWMQMPCTIKVTHKNQVPMLMAPRSEKGRGFFNLLCS